MAKPRPPKTQSAGLATPKRSNTPVILAAGVLILALAAIALLVTSPWSNDDTGSEATDAAPYQQVSVSGTPLPSIPASGTDTGLNSVAPTLTGKTFTGEDRVLKADGKPKVVIFLAHWCPHCQAELPLITDWVKANQSKYNVDYYAVATGTSPARPNYPPASWITKVGYPFPVLADDKEASAASAYGLSSYPYLVFLDGNNRLISRTTGEVPMDQFEGYIKQLTSSDSPTTTVTTPDTPTTTAAPSSPAELMNS